MTDYQLIIPFTLFVAGLFFFSMAALFAYMKEMPQLVMLWVGTAGILVIDALFAIHKIALDTLAADLSVATRVGYIVSLTVIFVSALLIIAHLFFKKGDKAVKASMGGFR